ncbi:TIGR02530 family flagellar biosynthesis protein [Natranaerobius thermophilus]|uniref:Flagellar operon protein n=1 Tax=Natranaerobius thermophilus (strain ATCC BAA-1301 / DSM 18059 / JW/NM-WN-LF) TaxID=457570 RepID=B2A351_NATTJ|nr:TIGR02530 family flagellar biosynthesis protein [Natranaerobius thermophilus]ACB84982.1 flagellar operon protein [Natranaerobius thermophilus JW/NM-WN-LF]
MDNIHGSRHIGPIIPPDKIEQANQKTDQSQQDSSKSKDFSKLLQRELEEVNFSKHAQNRIRSRNIELDDTKMEKLSEAINKAEAKGAKESLVVLDKTAFVVSVNNRTVITAADESQLKENVFTNIDSAVIM